MNISERFPVRDFHVHIPHAIFIPIPFYQSDIHFIVVTFPHPFFLRGFHWEISMYTFLIWFFAFPFYECEMSTSFFLRDFHWEIPTYTFFMWYLSFPFYECETHSSCDMFHFHFMILSAGVSIVYLSAGFWSSKGLDSVFA